MNQPTSDEVQAAVDVIARMVVSLILAEAKTLDGSLRCLWFAGFDPITQEIERRAEYLIRQRYAP